MELRLDVPEELPDVLGDHDRLLQIFENLLGNAFKFGAPGETVTVGARASADEVRFWVADDGPGIRAEDLPHVFDRFWQARKGATTGAGLGLPIVKGLVEAHGGQIAVDSVLGSGTTFTFTIPRATPAPRQPEPV
jgi:signal transduction histidine kinase